MLVGIEADSVMGNRNFCKKNFPWLYLEFFFFSWRGYYLLLWFRSWIDNTRNLHTVSAQKARE